MSDSHSMDIRDDHLDEEDALTQLYLRDLGEARRRKVWLGLGAIVLLFSGAAAIAVMLLSPQLGSSPQAATATAAPIPAVEPATAVAKSEPIPVLPKEPAGTTILVKKPEPSIPEEPAPAPAPAVQSSQQLANGYSIDLGAALSFSELSRRFGEIARSNQELPFDTLEPRATLKDTPQGLEARLVVGPFATEAEAAEICGKIALPSGVECNPAPFEGELISRQ